MDRRICRYISLAQICAKRNNTFEKHIPRIKAWHLHNGREDQAAQLNEYLESGLAPALKQSGADLIGAFATVIGPDAPCYYSLSQFSSLAAFQSSLEHLSADESHQRHLAKLSGSTQFPFVRAESSLLRSFDVFPSAALPESADNRPSRLFELRTYETPSYAALARKVGMFNQGEAQIFERLKMRPVFFGETIVGPRQPNLTYMLSFDNMAARDTLWGAFGSDPEWKMLSAKPELRDSEIVANISNAILRPLRFSLLR